MFFTMVLKMEPVKSPGLEILCHFLSQNMSFLCHEKMAKYVTKVSKYVTFSRLKTLKFTLLGHFYCQFFFQPGENETHLIKNWELISGN